MPFAAGKLKETYDNSEFSHRHLINDPGRLITNTQDDKSNPQEYFRVMLCCLLHSQAVASSDAGACWNSRRAIGVGSPSLSSNLHALLKVLASAYHARLVDCADISTPYHLAKL